MGSGVQSVMTSGPQLTLKWLAVSWDSLVPVPAGPEALLEGEIFARLWEALFCLILNLSSVIADMGLHLDESGWTMLDVGGQSQG